MWSISGCCSPLIVVASCTTAGVVVRPLTIAAIAMACAWWGYICCRKVTSAALAITPDRAAAEADVEAAAQSGVMSNAADVTFLQQMYPHHAQAIAMAAMVNGRTTTPAVVQLATTIKGEQQPEMDHMTVLLRSLGQPAAATMPD